MYIWNQSREKMESKLLSSKKVEEEVKQNYEQIEQIENNC